MKKIEAVFLPFKLDNVHDVLLANNIHEYIVIEINAHDIERTPVERRSLQSFTESRPRLKLELVTNDRNATAIACAILRAARTRRLQDTKVTVATVERLVEIGTGELATDVLTRRSGAAQRA